MMDLDELEKLAKAASPGPWRWTPCETYTEHDGMVIVEACANVKEIFVVDMCDYMGLDNANAAYIAAVSPDVVLGMIAELRQAHAERDRLREANINLIANMARLEGELGKKSTNEKIP